MNNESNNYIITIVGILLTISELLPYIKTIKSNGIIQLIINFCIFLLKKDRNVINDETEQLLENFLEERLHEIDTQDTQAQNKTNPENKNEDKLSSATNLVFTSQNITITFNSPNGIKIS